MTNTPPEIERMVRDKIMARSGLEYCGGRADEKSAREIVKASFPPSLSEAEQPPELFKRLWEGN